MTDLREQVRDFTREFESSLPVIEPEQVISEEIYVLGPRPKDPGRRRLAPAATVVLAVIAIAVLALLAVRTVPDAPVINEPDTPTTSLPESISTTVQTEPTLSRAEILSQAEQFMGALEEGNDDRVFEMMGLPGEHPEIDRLIGDIFGTINQRLIRVAERGLIESLNDCEIVDYTDDAVPWLSERFGYPVPMPSRADGLIEWVRCAARITDPIYTAINGEQVQEWDFLVDLHGHVGPLENLKSSEFVLAARAFVEYALLNRPTQFETACFPNGNMPKGEIWRVQRELRLYMPPDCEVLYDDLAEEVAAWYDAGEAEHLRR